MKRMLLALGLLLLFFSLQPGLALAADNMCNVASWVAVNKPGGCKNNNNWIEGWGAARQPENTNSVPTQPEWTNANEPQPEVIRLAGQSNNTDYTTVTNNPVQTAGSMANNDLRITSLPPGLSPEIVALNQPFVGGGGAAPSSGPTASGQCSGTSCPVGEGNWVLYCTCPAGPSGTVNGKPVCELNCTRRNSATSVTPGNGICEQVDLCEAGTNESTCGNPSDPRGSGGKRGLLGFVVDSDCQVASAAGPAGTPPPGETPPPGGPTPTPPTPTTSFQCQQVKVFRNNVEISAAQIELEDVIVFRGFASATNTTVSKLRFVLTKGGVAQTPVDVNATLVGALYQADYQVTIDTATSYSVTATPISP